MKNPIFNKEEIRADLNKSLEQYKRDLDITLKLLPILEKQQGKPITSRIDKELKKAFPDFAYAQLVRRYGFYEIEIGNTGKEYDNRYYLHFAYIGTHKIYPDMEYITNKAQCYLLNKTRIPFLEKQIKELDSILDPMEEAAQKLKQLKEKLEASCFGDNPSTKTGKLYYTVSKVIEKL